ncbi:Flp family type IVb pilin [Sulfitobacter pacificus]|uniref:Pilus assembly protein n=1 Tax=Sulfitobacter pacificus TaxID=1499314 RepID=A0ABQ5VER9_9RHOB|nr:hypothetical protein [Sulfitobacter pacificus]GLQ25858.1 hypothetical protein GCM10007927_06610 [Sulfitobacter pacificus]
MLNKFCTFIRSEDGAVTVDWVVLTAAVVGLAIIAILAISGPTGSVGTTVGSWLSDYLPGTSN